MNGEQPVSDRKRWLQPDMVVAGCAVLISLCALVMSYQEAVMTRAHHRAAVWPYLEFSYTNLGEISWTLVNRGTGPARIRSIHWEINGTPVRSWSDAMRQTIGHEIPAVRSYMHDRVLSPNQEIKIIKMEKTEEAEQFVKMVVSSESEMSLCYCSVYEECWTTLSDTSGRTEQIKGPCTIDPENDFRD